MLMTRKVYKLEEYITIKHIELMNIIIMVTGSIVGVAYITELFMAWYSGVEYEQYAFLNDGFPTHVSLMGLCSSNLVGFTSYFKRYISSNLIQQCPI